MISTRKYNFTFLFFLLCFTGLVSAEVKVEGEPLQEPGDVPLGGVAGCYLKPPKDGCNVRVQCKGVGAMYGSAAMSVRNATKRAQIDARGQLALFVKNKAITTDENKQAVAGMAQLNASGGEDAKEMESSAMNQLQSMSAEEVLTGFQVRGRQIDVENRTVTIIGGVSCKSQAAAAKIREVSGKSGDPNYSSKKTGEKSAVKSGSSTQSSGPVKYDKVEQKNSDDF